MPNQTTPIYLKHPEDRADEQPHMARVADELARAFLTPKLALQHEPVDLFYLSNGGLEKFSDDIIDLLLDAYRQHHAWQESIELNVASTLFDLTEPRRQIATVQQLRAVGEENAEFSTFLQFCALILGESGDSPEAMAHSALRPLFFDRCRHTSVLEVGDGEQLLGFLSGTVRAREDDKAELVALIILGLASVCCNDNSPPASCKNHRLSSSGNASKFPAFLTNQPLETRFSTTHD